MDDSNVQEQMYYLASDIQYCWKNIGGAIYYSISPIIFYTGATLFILPCLIGMSSILKPMLNSHLWHILEELTFQAFLIQYVLVVWFFASRESNTLLSKGYLIQITFSSCIMSYFLAIPFYMIVERPFKNFLDLILFPKSSIFKKQKDLEDSDESSDDDKDSDEGVKDGPHKGSSKQKKIMCGFCQDQVCDCKCLINKKKCKCVGNLQNTILASPSKKKPKTLLKDTI